MAAEVDTSVTVLTVKESVKADPATPSKRPRGDGATPTLRFGEAAADPEQWSAMQQ